MVAIGVVANVYVECNHRLADIKKAKRVLSFSFYFISEIRGKSGY
jgi:hypothetical protein